MLRAGIVGLPNVGKSTLFNALVANAKAEAANYPFCTIEPNVGSVSVPDERLQVLANMVNSESIVPTRVEFVDIAGLVKGASQGEGLGSKFLSHIREVDTLVQVVRCFEDDDIIHVSGVVDPQQDIEVINLELILADIDQIEKRIDRARKTARTSKEAQIEVVALEKLLVDLNAGKPARQVELSDEESESIKGLGLLTRKPTIYAANVSEDDLATGNAFVEQVKAFAAKEDAQVTIVSAQVEAELLELRTYFTTGPKETRAWTIKAGMFAPQAAGVIHSDFEKGFIRAKTISYADMVATGSMQAAKDKGLLRSEGKEYLVQEGDIMEFLHS
jgi:ribosome-binding ATPase